MPRSWSQLLGEENAQPEPEADRAGLFSRLRDSLSKSRRALTAELASAAFDPGDDAAWERLEEALIRADVGVRATAELVRRLEARQDLADLNSALVEELENLLGEPGTLEVKADPSVLLVVVVNVDTAGRLHTQRNLMQELAKVRRVIETKLAGAPHETLLVVDATTGQNGLQQARLFGEAVGVTGVALTKLDGSAKGGIAIPIAYELGLPVKLIGVGEQLDDLRPFDAHDYARALVGFADRD